jgi:hypothetical protein
LDDFRKALNSDVIVDEIAKEIRKQQREKAERKKQDDLKKQHEARERERLREEDEEREQRGRIRRQLADEEAEEKDRLAKEEERRKLEEKQLQDQRSEDFLAYMKVLDGQSKFITEADYNKINEQIINDLGVYGVKAFTEFQMGNVRPLTEYETFVASTVQSWSEKSGARDHSELREWLKTQYKTMRAQYFRDLLKDSGSILRFGANSY